MLDPDPTHTLAERGLLGRAFQLRQEAPCFACVVDKRRRTIDGELVYFERSGDTPPGGSVLAELGSELDRGTLGDHVGPPLDRQVEDWPIYWRRLLERSGADPERVRAGELAHTCEDRDLAFWIDVENEQRRAQAQQETEH